MAAAFVNALNNNELKEEEAEVAAASFKQAFKGFGTDEARVIKELLSHTNGQLLRIQQKYLTMYGRTLEHDVKKETSGHFLEAILALLEPLDQYEAVQLKHALQGIEKDHKAIIQIICPKNPHEIQALNFVYSRLYGTSVEADLEHHLSGDLERILRSIATGRRSDSPYVDPAVAIEDANALLQAGEAKLGTDEAVFIRVFGTRSFPQLVATFAAYKEARPKGIEHAIKSEMSGHTEDAFLAIVEASMSVPAFYAIQLHHAMEGPGTRDSTLIRLLVSRSRIDLNYVKEAYAAIFGKSLFDAVKKETSGHYRELLLGLIERPVVPF